jgi:hypothetical protein
MALATELRKQIKQFPEGKPFGYSDLRIANADYGTAAKALERFQKELLIKKISTIPLHHLSIILSTIFWIL